MKHLWADISSILIIEISRGERLLLLRIVDGYTLLPLCSNVKRVFAITLINHPESHQSLRSHFVILKKQKVIFVTRRSYIRLKPIGGRKLRP